jgi:type IV pilus assembly protein PilE
MEVAGRQQQRMLDVRSYASTLADLNLALPSEIAAHYLVTVTPAAAPPSFSVTATAVGGQAADQGCTALTLTNTGAKTPARCW